MHRIFDALCRLLAPITVFTADEAWSYLGSFGSVHLQTFPEPAAEFKDPEAEKQVAHLLDLRGFIGQAIEHVRQEKTIGNALEAAVVLRCDTASIANLPKAELEEFFILSELHVEPAEATTVTVSKTSLQKCARCWRHRPTVGKSAAHPELCDRCESVVALR
jgi:isoleucyl-tRNA synthetase